MAVEDKGRVIVFSYGLESSGIPLSWAASNHNPGVNLLKGSSDKIVQPIKQKVEEIKKQGDIVIASIHWGGNWGYGIPDLQMELAHKLIDDADIDIIHGHSSHHVKGIEVYNNKLIIYGSGDFLNDYEGIGGHEEFRPDLGLMYFVSVDPSNGELISLQMTPTQIKWFRVNQVSEKDAVWLRETLNREGKKFGSRVVLNNNNKLTLEWD